MEGVADVEPDHLGEAEASTEGEREEQVVA